MSTMSTNSWMLSSSSSTLTSFEFGKTVFVAVEVVDIIIVVEDVEVVEVIEVVEVVDVDMVIFVIVAVVAKSWAQQFRSLLASIRSWLS